MLQTCLILILIVILNVVSVGANLEESLRRDIEDEHLDDFSLIEGAFILSGVNNPDTLKTCVQWYENLLQEIRDFHLDAFDRIGSAAKVFSYLHTSWLIKYKEQATTLIDVIHKKQFNCVAGTILYNLVCEEQGWSTEAFETPTHTYTIFTNFTERVMVENTTSMGFNIMSNLREYSRYLIQFYPQNRAAQIGFDRIYAYENSQGRVITNTELLGLLAYNRAYFAMKDKDYKSAYEYVLLAQKFNRDSRSNVNFEIDLYYRWGKQLFDEGHYDDAFTVYADGYYRYPKINELAFNCRAAFFNALRQLWDQKDWENSRRLAYEIEALEILKEEERQQVDQIFHSWANYFFVERNKGKLLETIDYLLNYSPDDPQLIALKKAAMNMD